MLSRWSGTLQWLWRFYILQYIKYISAPKSPNPQDAHTIYDSISKGGIHLTDDKIILLISEKQQVGLEHLEKSINPTRKK